MTKGCDMATASLTPYMLGSSAISAHQALKEALKTLAQAKHCAVLWFKEIHSRKLYGELGYASIYLYAKQELGFSDTKTGDFIRLSTRLDDLPQLKKELEEGRIGYTKAREIIKVANAKNEADWLDQAHRIPRRELAKKVSQARKNETARGKENSVQIPLLERPKLSMPVVAAKHRVTLEMTTEQMARFESLWEKLHKMGAVPAGSPKAQVILEGMAALVESAAPQSASSTSPVQIHIRRCPECETANITTSRGPVAITAQELERLSCDAQIEEAGKPNRATIKPSLKRQVLSRDQHRCQAPGCRNTRFLEVHHLRPRKLGGTNDLKNLITLCSQCHTHLHEKNHSYFYPPAGKSGQKSGVR